MNIRLQSIWQVFCLLAFGAGSVTAADKPLKVFILAGQSNMQGHASISTFDSMADDPKTAPLLKEMRGPDGKPRVCEKVWISSVGCLGDAYSDLREKTGKLTAGFGAPENKIGPEFTFGLTMEKRLERADPHHQDRVGRAEPAHRLPPAQRRAGDVQRLHPEPVEEAGPRRGEGDGQDNRRTAACSTAT